MFKVIAICTYFGIGAAVAHKLTPAVIDDMDLTWSEKRAIEPIVVAVVTPVMPVCALIGLVRQALS